MTPSVMTDLPAEIDTLRTLCDADYDGFRRGELSQLLTTCGELQLLAVLMKKLADVDAAIEIVTRESKPRIV